MVGAASRRGSPRHTGAIAGYLYHLCTGSPGRAQLWLLWNGSSTHLFGEMFKARAGLDMIHVPYRGQGAALEDLIGGRIAAMFPIVPDVIAAMRADQVRALALAANSASGILPDVPLTPHLGYPDLIASAWVALYVPALTPAPIIKRLRAQLDAELRICRTDETSWHRS